MSSRRGLQLTVTIVGCVAVLTGSLSVLFGTSIIPDAGKVGAGVDSELRYYAIWYAVAGILLWRAAPRIETEKTIIRILAAALFLGGCSRLLSIVTVGMPHRLFLVLMVFELMISIVIVPWQAAVARAGD